MAAQDAGYTLAEMLAALLIVALAMGGAFQAADLLERQQRSVIGTTRALDQARETSRRFEALLAAYQGTGRQETGLQGDRLGFQFPCGGETCSARLEEGEGGSILRLMSPHPDLRRVAQAAHFIYLGEARDEESWPSSSSKRLRAVLLVADRNGGVPIAVARVWRQEPTACRFDTIARICREGGS